MRDLICIIILPEIEKRRQKHFLFRAFCIIIIAENFKKHKEKTRRLHKNYAKKEKNPRKEEIVLAEKSQVLYLWKLIRDRIQNVIPPVVFDTFIKDLEPEDVIAEKSF